MPGPTEQRKLEELLTMIGSCISTVALLFTFVLYAHYRHLRSPNNHLFMLILSTNLIEAVNYFTCIFCVPENYRQSETTCRACGFIEQGVSLAEPAFALLFWVHVMLLLTKQLQRAMMSRFFAFSFGWIVIVASFTASTFALLYDMYGAEGQAWCWIKGEYLWFRICFCWLWIVLAFIVMAFATLRPLLIPTLTDLQKAVILRRGALVVGWFVVHTINIVARYVPDEPGLLYTQAVLNPLLGLINVVGFLFSERMMTLRALGLPPGAVPPYGFTAAMRDVPEKWALLGQQGELFRTPDPFWFVEHLARGVRRDGDHRSNGAEKNDDEDIEGNVSPQKDVMQKLVYEPARAENYTTTLVQPRQPQQEHHSTSNQRYRNGSSNRRQQSLGGSHRHTGGRLSANNNVRRSGDGNSDTRMEQEDTPLESSSASAQGNALGDTLSLLVPTPTASSAATMSNSSMTTET